MVETTTIPLLDFSKYKPNEPNSDSTKEFLKELYHAMSEVGFFYIKNHGVPLELQKRSFDAIKSFFKLPIEEKLEIELKNSPHFRGYSRLSMYYSSNEGYAVKTSLLQMQKLQITNKITENNWI
jgi:isopenicillin N synthase-like dioxygenase